MQAYIAAAPLRQITGELDSAATLWLGHAACIAPSAVLAFHEIRMTRFADGRQIAYRQGTRMEDATAAFIAALPACVQALVQRDNALASGDLNYYTGAEILAACPRIAPCP